MAGLSTGPSLDLQLPECKKTESGFYNQAPEELINASKNRLKELGVNLPCSERNLPKTEQDDKDSDYSERNLPKTEQDNKDSEENLTPLGYAEKMIEQDMDDYNLPEEIGYIVRMSKKEQEKILSADDNDEIVTDEDVQNTIKERERIHEERENI